MEKSHKYKLIAFIPFTILIIIFLLYLSENWYWIVHDPVLKLYGLFILMLFLGIGIVYWLAYFLNKSEEKTEPKKVRR